MGADFLLGQLARMGRPYAIAYRAYHAEPPAIPWNDLLSAHLWGSDSWLISRPDCFLAARRVSSHWSDAAILDPMQTTEDGDAIHVYIAAGTLDAIGDAIPIDLLEEIHLEHTITTLTYQRRGYHLHRIPFSRVPI